MQTGSDYTEDVPVGFLLIEYLIRIINTDVCFVH